MLQRRPRKIRYGEARRQFGILRVPRNATTRPSPVVVFVHGGSWSTPYNRWVMALIERDARRRGWCTFNVEYRVLGRFGGGGGWPETFDDVRHAIELITDNNHGSASDVDATRIAVVGHSAGAHLALCASGTSERTQPAVVVSMSGPTDLERISANGSVPVDAIVRNAPEPERWKLTSPVEMLPLSPLVVCVHGDADHTVHPANSSRFVDMNVAAGGEARVVLVDGEAHSDALRPRSGIWTATMDALEVALG